MDMLDRVFGSCLRGWVVAKENVGDSKYIDYLPTRKWKYSDHNLMKDLSGHNTYDVMDLSDDAQGQTSSNIKLRLHDNVFLNPLNEAASHNVANESTESEEILMENDVQVTEKNNNTIEVSINVESCSTPNVSLPPAEDSGIIHGTETKEVIETYTEVINDELSPQTEDEHQQVEDNKVSCVENEEAPVMDTDTTDITTPAEEEPELVETVSDPCAIITDEAIEIQDEEECPENKVESSNAEPTISFGEQNADKSDDSSHESNLAKDG